MRSLLVFLLPLLLVNSASALLLEVSLNAPGDKLVTRDTLSGLDWLDLDQTLDLSYDDIQAGAGGWLADGWRYATAAEVCDLYTKFGLAPSPCPSSTPAVSNGQIVATHHNFLGVTLSTAQDIGGSGIYEDPNPGDGLVGVAITNYEFATNISDVLVTDDQIPTDISSPNSGSLLVRASPLRPMQAPGLLPLAAAFCTLLLTAAGLRRLRGSS